MSLLKPWLLLREWVTHVEHPFRVMKRQMRFQKTWLHGLLKIHCKVNVLAKCTNLYTARHQLLCIG